MDSLPPKELNELYESITQIEINKYIKTLGFFMIIKEGSNDFYYLLIRTPTSNEINPNKLIIDIFYKKNKKKTIQIDNNGRFILIKKEINLMIIEILKNDKIIEHFKFLGIDFNYKNDYNFYKNQNIFQLYYSSNEFSEEKDKKIISGKILNISEKQKYYFFYSLNPECFLPGMPILTKEYKLIIGIQFNKTNNNNEYAGIFIGIIVDSILKHKKNFKINENEVRIKTPDKINENEDKIYILDKIITKSPKQNEDHNEFFNFLKREKNSEYFVEVSILNKKKYDKVREKFENKFNKNDFTELEKSCIGSILGMPIGDAIGARVEFRPVNYNVQYMKDMGVEPAGKFNLKPGQWTDDSSMGLCIADSLIENKGNFRARDIMMRFILWWFYGYNNCFRFDKERKKRHSVGLGGNISGSFKAYINNKGKHKFTNYGDQNTSGNGSIMRNAAIPICYFKDKDEALKYAEYQSLITHRGDEAADCCKLLTFIIIKILKIKESSNKKNLSLKDILDDLEEFKCKSESVKSLSLSMQEGKNKNRDWNWKNPNFRYSEERAKNNPGYIGSYCMDGLSMALHVLYTTNTFEDAVLKAANLCGDSDSVASVVGQIAGAFYGLDNIPKEWIKILNQWDKNEIALRGYILCHLDEM